jgi:hypothetical protein
VQFPRAITLTPRDVVVDAGALQTLKHRFERDQCVLLPGLLGAALLELLRPRLDASTWSSRQHGEIGSEAVCDDVQALGMLHFAVNAPALIDAIRRISGCMDITWFEGRIFRMNPAAGHHDSWHDDAGRDRLVGMSVNLSFEGFDGGEFEIRPKGSTETLGRISNLVAGNASLFRIAPHLEHRVAPLTGPRARTAFAGWFHRGEPDLLMRLRAE